MDPFAYAADPEPAPDADFEPGRLEHLVAGNRGRLLDDRRTPVAVRGVDQSTASFTVEVGAFEDAGARWDVALAEVGRFQFARGEPLLPAAVAEHLRTAVARFDQALIIDPDPRAVDETAERLEAERRRAVTALDAHGVPGRIDPGAAVAGRQGDAVLTAAVAAILDARGLGGMDEAFATRSTSNPWSGELVKGHAIVAARLGLARYDGTVVRDPDLFAGTWSEERRGEHLLARLALTGELWRRAGAVPTLYRAAHDARPPRSTFVSFTMARAVAEAHAKPVMIEQPLPLGRTLMTFLETAAFNRVYREAEALILRP